MRIYLLDMGTRPYGDCVLVVDGARRLLIDGGHPGDDRPGGGAPPLQEQIAAILGEQPPFALDLLVVTHCHSDHIGCLPELYARQLIRPRNALVADEKLGFGHPLDSSDAQATDPLVEQVVAALREEPLASDRTDAELANLLLDAATLEKRYTGMLSALERDGVRIVRHGRDDPTTLLADVGLPGLEILGPGQEQLVLCADAIREFGEEARDTVMAMRQTDAHADAISLYRAVAGSFRTDGFIADSPGKGAALNDQSIVLAIGERGRRALLSADMQFAKPEVGQLGPLMTALRSSVASAGPFAFAKLPHHGSYNGVDASLLAEWQASNVAVSTGAGFPAHPSRATLKLLETLRGKIRWARTDRNGLVTIDMGGAGADMTVQRGALDDGSPNLRPDLTVSQPVSGANPGVPAGPQLEQRNEMVEVTARIPTSVRKVVITVEIDGDAPGEVAGQTPAITSGAQSPISGPANAGGDPVAGPWTLARGRTLPSLLFVTEPDALAGRIGKPAVDAVRVALRSAGQQLLELPTADPLGAVHAAAAGKEGIVLLGGYDVVPSWRFDVLPPDLRTRLGASTSDDDDDFLVWSDQPYADADGDGMAELAISRLPDGGDGALFRRMFESGAPAGPSRFALRNSARPFADAVLDGLPGRDPMRISAPILTGGYGRADLDRASVYVMLHGSDEDGTHFWGEDAGRMVCGMSLGDLGPVPDATVFAGCCWGALIVDETAQTQSAKLTPRTPANSLAMAFLAQGARAFVGCTGTHYSPGGKDAAYFGGPMHTAFWHRLSSGDPPARALFEARLEFIAGMPHGRRRPSELAIEYKILRQFTCLGLGW